MIYSLCPSFIPGSQKNPVVIDFFIAFHAGSEAVEESSYLRRKERIRFYLETFEVDVQGDPLARHLS